MNEQFIEHWRQVAEFDYPALQAENERLTDFHRKAVAATAILLAEKDDRDEEIERLREALRETLKALIEAQNHIHNELQPEFEELAEYGRLSNPWESEEYDQYKAARRLATWWHGCGTDETIELARQALAQTKEKP